MTQMTAAICRVSPAACPSSSFPCVLPEDTYEDLEGRPIKVQMIQVWEGPLMLQMVEVKFKMFLARWTQSNESLKRREREREQ